MFILLGACLVLHYLLQSFVPFLNCIQVTSVGINTEWGLLLASISEDNGEETPLQVCFFFFGRMSSFL